MEKTKATHGGARPGAGRKKTIAARYEFGAPQDVADILSAVPDRAAYILQAIRAYATAHPDELNKRPAEN